MTKDEIIEVLLAEADTMEELERITHDSEYAKKDEALREAVELLKTAPEWISTKDRLPARHISVLCYIPRLRSKNECWIGADGVWHSATAPADSEEITHWMPMPELPKEEVTHEQD